jgi:GYF domain 2
MNYMLQRDGQQYGPYTLADLQRYVAAGNVLITDLVKSEGMEDWVPLSQVIGNIPVPVAPVQPAAFAMGSQYPSPPDLHWGILLAIDIVTCGLFGWAWIIVEAAWVKKVQPASKSFVYVVSAISLFVLATILNLSHPGRLYGSLLNLGALGVWLMGIFGMKSALEEHFNTAEPIGLRLSGVMVFFFNVIYFQYHFNEIARAKKAQQLSLAQHA